MFDTTDNLIVCGKCKHFELFGGQGLDGGVCHEGIKPIGDICHWSETITECNHHNCRWKSKQRQKVMGLAKEYGGKASLRTLLDINTEVTLLKLFADEQEGIAPC